MKNVLLIIVLIKNVKLDRNYNGNWRVSPAETWVLNQNYKVLSYNNEQCENECTKMSNCKGYAHKYSENTHTCQTYFPSGKLVWNSTDRWNFTYKLKCEFYPCPELTQGNWNTQ